MKPISLTLILCLLAAACSTSKKAPKHHAPVLSRTDILKGGTSFDNPIVIIMPTERQALDEEYRWLSINYPGYTLGRKNETIHASRYFDIVQIKTREGRWRPVYFDCTAYRGRH